MRGRNARPTGFPPARDRRDGSALERCTEALEPSGPRLRQQVGVGRGGKQRDGELAHESASVGRRYDSASATCSASTVSAPASAAIVAATRATRAWPRPESGRRSTAHWSSSSAAAARTGSASRSRERAARTRARTTADLSPCGPASSCPCGRGTVSARSKRSSSAREASRGTGGCAPACRHSERPDLHGHRRDTGSSLRRAGTGLGARRASRRGRRRRRRLRVVVEALRAPAAGTRGTRRGTGRPGARDSPHRVAPSRHHRRSGPRPSSNGVARGTAARGTSPAPGGSVPQTEWMRVTSRAAWSARSGSRLGQTAGEHRLPRPGGPASSRLCPPAAAISSARRARS